MHAEGDATGYFIWGADKVVYGPVDLPVLVSWVQEERVVADTWVHVAHEDSWSKAGRIAELLPFFQSSAGAGRRKVSIACPGRHSFEIRPGSLRRVKVFGSLSDDQLVRFAEMMEIHSVRQGQEVVRENSPGDAMYLILEGEVRVRLIIGGKETILATLSAGEFFGEVALFDHGPRSADVVANADSQLLRISAESFYRLVDEKPELAAPFLLAVSRALIGRIRADNKRYRDSIAFARALPQ